MTVNILPLFPVALGYAEIELDNWNFDFEWSQGTKIYTGHRQQIGLEKLDQFKELKDKLETACKSYCESLENPCSTLSITQMWANCYDKGSQIHQHPHPNSLISGVFYLDNFSSTTFVNPTIPQIKLNYSDSSANLYNSEHFTARGARGRVYMFPSWLQHRGEPSEADQRITISFNSFPRELGNYDRLDYWRAD